MKPQPRGPSAGLLLASRGDALTPHLFAALAARYPVSGRLDPELSAPQRLAVAALSFRPSRRQWVERFYKSPHGYRLRSSNAARQRVRLHRPDDPVLQVHALFQVRGARSLLYVDCTHQQSATQWPAWNPLHGEALRRWYQEETGAYRSAVHIFAFSRATRESLIGSYGVRRSRITVVGGGVNLTPVPSPRTSPDGSAGPRLLFVGNDFTRKGGPELLTAFRRVRDRFPRARLQLVGTDPGIRAQPGVEVLGRIGDRARMAQLFAAASAFCLPSHFDPYPLALLEAMGAGLPCVSTPSCGIPDIITHGVDGVLVPAGDPPALERALLALLSNPATAARIGTAARRRVRNDLTWDHVVNRMAPVLDRLLYS